MSDPSEQVMRDYYAQLEAGLLKALCYGRRLAVSEPRCELDGARRAYVYRWDMLELAPGAEPPLGRRWWIYEVPSAVTRRVDQGPQERS